MATDDDRAELLRRAITATAESEAEGLHEIFHEDVTVWTPTMELSSRDDLAAELRARDEAFADLDVDILATDVVGDRGYAEWEATLTHTGVLTVDDVVVDATGEALTLKGVTVAEFSGDHIVALRQYWDESDMLAALGVLPPG